MNNKLYEFLNKKATGKMVLIFLLLTALMEGLMLVVEHQFSVRAQGQIPLDSIPFYSAETARQFFAVALGGAAKYYLHVHLPLDLFYPALYSFSYALIVAWSLMKLRERGHIYPQWLMLYPFASALFDYLENTGMFLLFQQDVLQSEMLLFATAWCSSLKWFGAFSGLSIMLYLIFKLVITRFVRVGLPS